MRVALFTHGGVGRPGSHSMPALVNLISRLAEWFDVSVFVPSVRGEGETEYFCGAARVRPIGCLATSSIPRLSASFRAAFLKEHRRAPFQLLNGFWAYPSGAIVALLSRLYGVPSVISVRGGDAGNVPEIGYGLLRHPVLKQIVLATLRSADAVITLTRYQAEELRRHGLARGDVRIIPSGVPANWLIPTWNRSVSTPFRLLHVGNLTEVKDQETLLQAFSIIRQQVDARLTIVGPDHLGGRLQTSASTRGLNEFVRFAGFVPPDELLPYYEQSDLMLHTSLFEGQGVVLAEAAATGVVVCGTRVGLIADLSGSCMRASDCRDSHQLAANAINVLKNPPEFATLQRNARKWAEDHQIDWTAESYMKVYENLVGTTLSG